jgi:hypothetical protein
LDLLKRAGNIEIGYLPSFEDFFPKAGEVSFGDGSRHVHISNNWAHLKPSLHHEVLPGLRWCEETQTKGVLLSLSIGL